MGKYMKKGRGVGEKLAVMEMSKSQLGVRTRAMEKKENNILHDNDNAESFETVRSHPMIQYSYLELRSRRLEKVVGCSRGGGRGSPYAHKSTLSSDCRRLSDLTNSGTLVDDCSSKLMHSKDARLSTEHLSTCSITHGDTQNTDENRGFAYGIEEENVLHSSLRDSIISVGLFQGNHQLSQKNRGRNAPGVAHSRSNSITREFSSGILTRYRRKLEMKVSAGVDYMSVDSRRRNKNGAHNGSRNYEVEVSYEESPIDEILSTRTRIIHESSPSSHAREAETPPAATRPQHLAVPYYGASQHSIPPPITSMDMDIEDFLSQAEKCGQRRFIERYNFDPSNETPLPGRFEWINLHAQS